ncbi:hypothetical protein DFQ10_101929 [Winogradskyella eximia]|uniref:Uncharacterized protein n=1 Tax=Winogradskyella eximia TaxID=262006 RepID=A0A3D9HDS4_9FLAO|nr:DUF6090 family protein [Winogradskyella eximia]RED47146.1 hypothetical protein DFQ10_101929 [Winogradskyella eximia]
MLKFFRKIRYNLISKNKTGKYIKYALGEIILVVIGILIALQINNWNGNRKDVILEKEYLTRLKSDLEYDQSLLKRITINRYERKVECLEKGKAYNQGNYIIKDTLQFLDDIGYGGVFGNVNWSLNTNTYNELISTGNLRKIKSDSLRNNIITYYENSNAYQISGRDYISGYINFVNSLRPYNSKNKESDIVFDTPTMLKHLKTEEYYRLANLELTLAHSVTNFADKLIQQSQELVNSIETALKD